MTNKTMQEKFIEKAKEVHGNKYDYSKVDYISTKTKIIIICPIHGEFTQTPNDHIYSKSGCQKCAALIRNKNIKLTIEKFIKKAKAVHGNKYDYSKVSFEQSHSDITIICQEHGEFQQKVYSHLQGHGCFKCMVKNNTFTENEFIEKAQQIHNNKYNYSKTKYVDSKTKVTIICPIHGDFEQKVNTHLQEHGCPKCSSNYLFSTNKFIQKAITIHGNKYDYSKVDYTGMYNKIIIICKKHKEFEQISKDHIKGAGCPRCNKSKGEIAITEILEKNNIKSKEEYRIPEVGDKLYYDFYLPENKLLIEFHGEQHYRYVNHFHKTEDKFLKQKERDDIIRYNARRWKYTLIEFNYKQFKELSKDQFEELIITSINKFKRIR